MRDPDRLPSWVASAPGPMRRVLEDVRNERAYQDGRWGEQNHPDGTGPSLSLFGLTFARWRDFLRESVDRRAQDGQSLWALIALEEVFEALAEDDVDRLRGELVQAAAVFVSWVEALDRRRAREVTTTITQPDPGEPWVRADSEAGAAIIAQTLGRGLAVALLQAQPSGALWFAPADTPMPDGPGLWVWLNNVRGPGAR